MEGRMKKYVQVSPERAKVWTEKSPKYHYNQQYHQQKVNNQKVPVVYYMYRNQQLEQPHFIEVPLSSSDGLYLRDVIERLNVLRGRGMASMYSWSCKRSYKNGFVWHDLCDDDLIIPPHGNEYVLKGSELFQNSNSGSFSPAAAITLRNHKALPEPQSSTSQEESSSSTSLSCRVTKSFLEDELSPPDSLSLTEYKVYRNDDVADASTQTDENTPRIVGPQENETRTIFRDFISPSPTTPMPSSTLESLIRSDAKKLNSIRILEEEEEFRMPSSTKFKASTMILQLLSCGSIPVKNHSFGLIPTYKSRFSPSEFSSPLYSTSILMGELAENPRLMGMRLETRKNFSGNLFESSIVKEGGPKLTRSSSYNADRTEQFDSTEDKEHATGLKCIPRSKKASFCKQPRSESIRSPLSEGPTISSYRVDSSRTESPGTPNGWSNGMNSPLSGKEQSRKDKENVIQVEERLASGARVIIQSIPLPDYNS